jgi:hypothetical protein
MSRSYYRWTYSPSEGAPFHAGLAVQGMIHNTQAASQVQCWDALHLLAEPDTATSGWYHGPCWIPLRRAESGQYRSIAITPFAIGGTGAKTLTCSVMDRYGAPDDEHLSASWSIADGSTCVWGDEEELRPLSSVIYPSRSFPVDVERCRVDACFLVWEWSSVTGSPMFGGFRVREVGDS